MDNSLRIQIQEKVKQLETNPYVGKPLGYEFFREKKVLNYRFYYLIYEGYVVVFLIDISNKKDPQNTIDKIKIPIAPRGRVLEAIVGIFNVANTPLIKYLQRTQPSQATGYSQQIKKLQAFYKEEINKKISEQSFSKA